MKKMFLIILLALAALAAPRPAQAQPGQPAQDGNRVYMSQTYVDTTVLRALYILNEGTVGYSINRNRQRQAVNQAKAILNRLKEQAKGDPNERYVLMRVGEAEYQIALEEEEMRKIDAEKNLLAANQLVLQYNSEVGKQRPDFALLRSLFRRMSEVDQRQANNLADSYNKRYRQISREAQHSLEKALAANDFRLARLELEYCEKNKNYLMISGGTLARQRERLERLENAQTELPKIIELLNAGEKAFTEMNLSESRTSLTMANNRLQNIAAQLPPKDAGAHTARAARLIRALDAREDSLVAVALSVLDKQGPEGAQEYLREVLIKRANISNERAAIVDHAITQARPQRAITLGEGVEMVNVSVPSGSAEEMTGVRRRAQARADSLKKVRDRAANVTLNIFSLLENKRPKDAARLFEREKAFLASTLHKSDFETLEQSVARGAKIAGSATAVNKNKAKAEQNSEAIYALLENNRVKDAHKLFQKNRKHLSRHLDADSFKMLEMTVTQSYGHR